MPFNPAEPFAVDYGEPAEDTLAFDPSQAFTFYDGPSLGEKARSFIATATRAGIETGADLLEGVAVLAKKWDDVSPKWSREYEGKEARDLGTYKAGQALREFAATHLPGNPELVGSVMWETVPEVTGSFGAYLLGGFGAGAVKASALGATSVMAATQGTAQAYGEAKAAGVDEQTALDAGVLGLAPGIIQVVPVLRALRRFDPTPGKGLYAKIMTSLASGSIGAVEEGVAEMLGQVGQNAIARGLWDADRELSANVAQQGTAGGAAGFIVNALVSALPGRGHVKVPTIEELAAPVDQGATKAPPAEPPAAPAKVAPVVRKPTQEGLPIEMHGALVERAKSNGMSDEDAKAYADRLTTPIEQFDLTEPIRNADGTVIPAGSTVSRQTLEKAGYAIPAEAEPGPALGEVPTAVPEPIPGAIPASQVLENIMAANPNADRTATEQLLGKADYVPVQVPIEEVGPSFGTAGEEKVGQYTQQPAETAPPVVLAEAENGQLRPVDGKHRVAAARRRGDKTIPAYVPAEISAQFAPIQPEPALPGQTAPPAKKPVVPEVAPERDGAQPPGDTTALKMEEIDTLREALGLDELPAPQRKRFLEVLAGAKRKNLSATADSLASSIIEKPRQVTAEEHAGMVLRSAELQNQFERLQTEAAVEVDLGNLDRANLLEQESNNVLDSLDVLTRASDLAGTEIGRALSIRRMRINRRSYDLATSVQRLQVAKKARATPEEIAQLRQLTESLAAQQKTIERLQIELAGEREKLAKVQAETFVSEGRARRRQAAASSALERRKVLKNELAALGYRLNDITNSIGLSIEAANIVAKIAQTYIEEGAATLSEVTGKLKQDIPDLSDNDIYNALGGRIKAVRQAVENEAKARVRELTKQARLWARIHDALNRQFDKGAVPRTSEQVRQLRQILGKLRLQADRAIHDDAALKRVHEKINEVQAQLQGGFRNLRPIRQERVEPSVDVQALRRQLRELERLMRTQDAIADLKEQIRTGDFKVSAPEQRAITNERLQQALVERQQLQRKVNQLIEEKRSRTPIQKVGELALGLRAVKATADMSAVFRQANILIWRRPGEFAKAFAGAFKAFFDANTADAIDIAIKRHPNQVERIRAGLYLSELDGTVNTREETFAGRLQDKIPVLRAIAAASERHMVTMLNLMRAATFDQFVENFPESSLEERQAWAYYVNVASGRGNLGRFNNAARQLSLVFFAPRYAVSRFQVPYALVRGWKHPVVRKQIALDLAHFAGAGMSALALAYFAGFRVGLDPDDSDFGKIIVGDTRIDIWGGMQQAMRLLLAPIMAGLDRAGVRKQGKEADLIDAGRTFLSYKLSPTVTVPAEMITGRTIIGEDRELWESALRSITPLVIEDTLDVMSSSQNAAKTSAAAAASFFGIGVQEHSPRNDQERRIREAERAATQAEP